jgi:hypothetical protein
MSMVQLAVVGLILRYAAALLWMAEIEVLSTCVIPI